MNTGILYLTVINQFLNQEHDIEATFKSLIQSKDWGEVRRIPLPVYLGGSVARNIFDNFITEDGKVNKIYLSDKSESEISSMIRPLMDCDDSTISEHFRMLNIYIFKALDHTIETRKHRTFLVTLFEKA